MPQETLNLIGLTSTERALLDLRVGETVLLANENEELLYKHADGFRRIPDEIYKGIADGDGENMTLEVDDTFGLRDGVQVTIKTPEANAANATLNVNETGAKNLVDSQNASLEAGALMANAWANFRYNATYDCFFLQGSGGDVTVSFSNFIMPNAEFTKEDTAVLGAATAAKATTDYNGDIWVTTGTSSGTQYVYKINAATNTRTSLTAIGAPMFESKVFKMSGIQGGGIRDIWAAAGDNTASAVVSYDIPSGTRTARTALGTARYGPACAVNGNNGDIWIGGGRSGASLSITGATAVESFTPSGTRSARTALSPGRGYLAACTAADGMVWFIGGYSTTSVTPSAVVEVYSNTGTKTTATPLSVARYQLDAVLNAAGEIVVGGGVNATSSQSPSGVTAVGEKYANSTTQTIITRSMGIARANYAALLDPIDRVWFSGGNTLPSAATDFIDVINTSDTLSTLFMNTARYRHGATVDGLGNIWLAGGETTAIEKWLGTVSVPAPNGTKYSFNGQAEQTLNGVIINAPIKIKTGYIKCKSGVISN